jgi:DNA topoisomerase-1
VKNTRWRSDNYHPGGGYFLGKEVTIEQVKPHTKTVSEDYSELLSYFPALSIELEDKQKMIGLPSVLKYGTAESGNYGHAGGEGGVGKPGGSTEGVGPVEDARDASKAEKLGLERAVRGEDGKWQMEDGSKLPKHIREGLGQPIPPAWRNVYVNPDPKSCKEGCLAVRGRDAAGRIQGLYSKEHRGGQSEEKFSRVKELDGKIMAVVSENDKNLKGPQAENASVLRLIIATGIRPGSDDDTKAAKQAYGATTLLGKHVYKTGDGVELRFTGKKGVDLTIRVNDPKVAKEVLSRASAAGKGGRLYDTNYKSLWTYTKELDGKGYLPKDFRTLMGTRLAVDAMKKIKVPTNEKEYKKAVKEVATQVSSKLGNTPTIALQSYINPAVWGQWRKKW